MSGRKQEGNHQPHGGTAHAQPLSIFGIDIVPPARVAETITNPKQRTPMALSQASTETPLPYRGNCFGECSQSEGILQP
jgi:hypothetical protein